jgi:peptide/nickel transport system permease protein
MVTLEPVSSEAPDATRGAPRAAWRNSRGMVRQWLWGDTRSRLATCVLAIVLLMAIAAPLIARYSPTAQNFIPFRGPSSAHWLGTDDLGRDVWSRLVYGARASMEAAGIAVSIALVIGMPIGLLAGFRGGWVDAVLMRVADTVLSFPGIILAIAITAVLGPSLVHSMIAVGIVFSPSIARLARSQVLVTRERVYVDAAVSFGSPPWRIVMRHIVPNSIQPVVIQATFMLGLAVIAEASLSFVGLGVQDPAPSFGVMLQSASQFISVHPFGVYPPGIAIALIVLAFNALGDSLRDVLDPVASTRRRVRLAAGKARRPGARASAVGADTPRTGLTRTEG